MTKPLFIFKNANLLCLARLLYAQYADCNNLTNYPSLSLIVDQRLVRSLHPELYPQVQSFECCHLPSEDIIYNLRKDDT